MHRPDRADSQGPSGGSPSDTPDVPSVEGTSRTEQALSESRQRLLTLANDVTALLAGDFASGRVEWFPPFEGDIVIAPGVKIRKLHDDPQRDVYIKRFEPGATIPLHTHPQTEILTVTNGVLRARYGASVEETLHEGESVRLPPLIPHSFTNITDETVFAVVIYAPPIGLTKSFLLHDPIKSEMGIAQTTDQDGTPPLPPYGTSP